MFSLRDRPPPPPPDELKDLHFSDYLSYAIPAEPAKQNVSRKAKRLKRMLSGR